MSSARRVEDVMGSVVDIDVRRSALDEAELTALIDTAVERLHEIDRTFSTYKPESEISRLGRGELSIDEVSDDVRAILDLSDKLYAVSNGSFDIYAAAQQEPAATLQQSTLANARPLEPSGVVKGWGIQQAVDILKTAGLDDFCINLGGDLYASGVSDIPGGWRIGLQHPVERMKVMAVLEVRDAAVATSGLYERGAHIVGNTAGLVSVTIVGADITLADAYATCAFAMGPEGLAWASELPGFHVFGVDDAGMTHFSPGMKAYLVS